MTHYGRRQIVIIAALVAVLILSVWAAGHCSDFDIWWRYPGQTYWQQCVSITDSGGIGPVRYIPDGAVIAIRDKQTWTLVPITRGK